MTIKKYLLITVLLLTLLTGCGSSSKVKVAYVNKKYEVGTSVKFDDYEITLEEAKMVQDKKIQMQCS